MIYLCDFFIVYQKGTVYYIKFTVLDCESFGYHNQLFQVHRKQTINPVIPTFGRKCKNKKK